LSDFYPHGAVTQKYGVLRSEGYSERALFIVDKTGAVRYIDIHDIDHQPDNDVVLGELRRIDPQAVAHTAKPEAAETIELPTNGIIMYCTSWCPACRRARRFLDERGIAYTEIDINKVPEARSRLRELTGGTLTTPTFDIHGQVIVNFQRDELERMLK